MSVLRPPFADVTRYAEAVASLVKDRRSARSDVDFVGDAVDRYSDFFPAVESADIGDASTEEWELGASGGPFENWSFGFSELHPLEVEELSSNESSDPPVFVAAREYRIEERTVSDVQKIYLVFQSEPPASPNQYRVRWRRKWSVTSSANEVRLHHQMGVVYLAASLKCEALSASYAESSKAAADLFSGQEQSQRYAELAKTFWYRAKQILGIGAAGGLSRGRVRTSYPSPFARGYDR